MSDWLHFFDRWRCLYLLVSLSALLGLYPYLVRGEGTDGVLFNLLFSLIMFAGLYSVSRTRSQFVLAGLLLVPAMFGNWATHDQDRLLVELVLTGILVCFLVLMSTLVLRYVFTTSRFVADRLCGALSVYFLMGFGFSELYRAIYTIDPQMFLVSGERALTIYSTRFIYFSFVTQTTMGYGDITPNSAVTEALTVLQATVGVLYVAVLVAWLVGSIRPIDAAPDDADSA